VWKNPWRVRAAIVLTMARQARLAADNDLRIKQAYTAMLSKTILAFPQALS